MHRPSSLRDGRLHMERERRTLLWGTANQIDGWNNETFIMIYALYTKPYITTPAVRQIDKVKMIFQFAYSQN